MTEQAAPADLAALYDRAPIGARYWRTFSLLAVTQMLDFFDFFIIIYLVVAIGPSWKLTFGQTATILLSPGVGAVIGALVWGFFADKWGRKPLIILGTYICAAASASVAAVPDGDWITLALLRFGVGFGLAASATPTGALIVEYTPTRLRTFAGSFIVVANSVGILLAGTTFAALMGLLGWRGVAALGVLPAVVGTLVWIFVPESFRWLISAGRPADARRSVAAALGVTPDALPMPVPALQAAKSQGSLLELFTDLRRTALVGVVWLFASTAFYGVYQWGPTIFAQLFKITPPEAAKLFIWVSVVGVAGKFLFSVLPQWIGRRRSGEVMGYASAVTLLLTGYFHGSVFLGVPAFMILLMGADLFFEGGLANIAPYSVEVFGVRLGARAVGLQQAANAVGKTIGPVILALIAGANNYVTPQATEAAVFPAFVFFAACSLIVGLCFTLIPLETHGKPLEMDVTPDLAPAAAGATAKGGVAA
jgi:MFS transporter, putative metabolite:H+ symporter